MTMPQIFTEKLSKAGTGSGIASIVILLFFMGNSVYENNTFAEIDDVKKIDNSLELHISLEGHPITLERIDSIHEDINEIKEQLNKLNNKQIETHNEILKVKDELKDEIYLLKLIICSNPEFNC